MRFQSSAILPFLAVATCITCLTDRSPARGDSCSVSGGTIFTTERLANPNADAKKIVVIDPGHGGTSEVGGSSANNATGPKGTKEKDLTLEVAKEVERVLKFQGYEPSLTRTTDVNLGLADRAFVAQQKAAKAFVSIHFNAFKDPKVQGTETLHHRDASDESKELARAVQARVLAVTGHRDRGVKPQELGVLQPSRHDLMTAACLVEVSFLTNAVEEDRLMDDGYKKRIAEAIAAGIADYIDPR